MVFADVIKYLREQRGYSQQSLADSLGLTRSAISNYEKGASTPNLKMLLDIVRFFDVSCDYLLGLSPDAHQNAHLNAHPSPQSPNEKYISEPTLQVSHRAEPLIRERILIATQDTSENPVFTVINLKAAANYLTGYQSQEYYENLAALSLPRQLVGTPRQGICLQIEGDSMETKFHHGDYIAAVLLEPHEYDQIRDLDCYIVVSSTYGIQFKRIKNRLRDYGFIRCRSDNRRHPSYNIEAENLLQLYRFVLHVSPDASNPNDTLYNKLDNLEDTTTDLRVMYEHMQEQMQAMEQRQKQALQIEDDEKRD